MPAVLQRRLLNSCALRLLHLSAAAGVPTDLAVPPPRPKRKSAKPYPRKVEGFSDIVNQVRCW